jgi:hypothetical protein
LKPKNARHIEENAPHADEAKCNVSGVITHYGVEAIDGHELARVFHRMGFDVRPTELGKVEIARGDCSIVHVALWKNLSPAIVVAILRTAQVSTRLFLSTLAADRQLVRKLY